jgi:hypothetical protein
MAEDALYRWFAVCCVVAAVTMLAVDTWLRWWRGRQAVLSLRLFRYPWSRSFDQEARWVGRLRLMRRMLLVTRYMLLLLVLVLVLVPWARLHILSRSWALALVVTLFMSSLSVQVGRRLLVRRYWPPR